MPLCLSHLSLPPFLRRAFALICALCLTDSEFIMPTNIDTFKPGQRVTVTHQIPQRARVWTTQVTGIVVSYGQKKTGSWFAHAKDDKLWLDRLTLKKDDGEIVVCNLDEFSNVKLHAAPKAAPAAAPAETATEPPTDTAEPAATEEPASH